MTFFPLLIYIHYGVLNPLTVLPEAEDQYCSALRCSLGILFHMSLCICSYVVAIKEKQVRAVPQESTYEHVSWRSGFSTFSSPASRRRILSSWLDCERRVGSGLTSPSVHLTSSWRIIKGRRRPCSSALHCMQEEVALLTSLADSKLSGRVWEQRGCSAPHLPDCSPLFCFYKSRDT